MRRLLPLFCTLSFATSIASTLVGETRPPRELRPQDWAEQTTLTDGWFFVRGDLGGVWETLRSDARALDLPVWQPVSLPHCYNASDAVDPDVAYYQGPAWYRTELTVANPHPGGRTLLHFEGAGQKSEVWIGEKRVGVHSGGYDEFIVDVTEAVTAYQASALTRLPATEIRVTPGRIPLAVRCDNSRDLEAIPSDLSDFNLYGGLYRPVHLVYLPAGGLERVHANPQRSADGQWSVVLRGRFNRAGSPPPEQDVSVRLVGPDGQEIGRKTTRVRATGELQDLATLPIATPHLWSPADPALYGVEITATGSCGTSQVWQRFGLRSFEFVERGPFRLNGERLLLQGTHRHEDHAGLGAAMTDPLMEEEMELMKRMGVNFIRLGHYQQSRRILELCDELGLLVWEEIPWCRGGLGGEAYQNQAKAMLRAQIEQHYNHPSVILWGLGNENDWPGDFSEFDQDAIREFMRELHELSHELDPGRLTAIRRCDFCRDIVDVYSPSIWAGWYRGRFTEYAEVTRREFERVPRFLHVEWGGDSHAGRHAEDPYAPLRELTAAGAADERGLDFMNQGGTARASRDGDWSETYICDLVDWHLKEQLHMDWLTGTAMWPFKDFSTPLRPENPIPFVNQKGAVERDLTPKEVYYVFQSYWAEEPMLRIYGHSWPVRWGGRGEKRWVKVYSNCDEVELWWNGVSQGVRRRDPADFPAAGLRWQVPFDEGMNTLKAECRRGGHVRADEITFRYEPRAWGAPHRLRLQQFSASPGTVRVQVELLDERGVVCLDAAQALEFQLAGDGRLVANQGTAGAARRVQLANGRASITVALAPGQKAVLSASVSGVPTELIQVTPEAERGAGPRASLDPAARAAALHAFERDRVLRAAATVQDLPPVSFRDIPLPPTARAAGVAPGDYYSMGDYWWPNAETADGLPYVRRDGASNPGNFDGHRRALREMRAAVATLAAAYLVSSQAGPAERAGEWLHRFFVDPATRMNPHLQFAQAIPGVTSGRGIGIIDTIHLAEVALAAEALEAVLPRPTAVGVKAWFSEYLQWMRTHPHGREEAVTRNNHSVAYWLQVAVFARYVGDAKELAEARRVFLDVLLPDQLAPDGSFPRELARTKPYGYSIFQLDNVALLTEVLSTAEGDLWHYTLPDGRGIARAIEFLFPYLRDRSAWPYPADIEHFDAWPVRQPALLLGADRLGRPEYRALWERLTPDPANEEVQRNMAVTQPVLWVRPRAAPPR